MKPAILIIDPISSTHFLVRRLHEEGFAIIALETMRAENNYTAYDPSMFDCFLTSTQDVSLDATKISSLQEYDLKSGFTGVTASVPYAEKLLAQLFPAIANDPRTSTYRCDKFMMNERLRTLDIPSVKQSLLSAGQTKIERLQTANAFLQSTQDRVCVIKPNTGSAGSFAVETVTTEKEIERYFDKYQKGFFGHDEFLIQEKLMGIEYYIDAVAFNGEYYISAIGDYERNLQTGLFEGKWNNNLSLHDACATRIKEYVIGVLQALEVKNGLYHIEVMYTPQGLRLIELNSRTSGAHGYLNIMAKSAHGVDQIDAYLALMRDQDPFVAQMLRSYDRLFKYKNRKGAYSRFHADPLNKLKTLASYTVLKPSKMDENEVGQTIFDIVAFIHLSAADQAAIEHDTRLLQQLEDTAACLES